MSALGASVTVVTTRTADGAMVGMTANTFNSVSLHPPLVLWCVRLESRSFEAFRQAPRFAVSVLSMSQYSVARRFSQPVPDRFAGIEVHEGLGGLPLIAGCAASFECKVETMHVAGDHAIFLGLVERCCQDEKAMPLILHKGRQLQGLYAPSSAN